MNSGKIGTGCVVVWHSTEAHVETLRDGLKEINLERFCPPPRSKYVAMQESVRQCHGSYRNIIRPLAGRKGFEVKSEEKGEEENQHDHVVSYIFLDDDNVTNSPYDKSLLDNVLANYANKIGLCSPKDLTSAVADIITKRLNGICLKDGGAVYWLPGEMVPQLFDVEKKILDAAPSFQLSVFRHEMTDREKASVVAVATAEMAEKARKLTELVTSGELGTAALRNRERDCDELIKLAKYYENELSVSLTGTIEAIEAAKVAASAAAIMIAAQEEVR